MARNWDEEWYVLIAQENEAWERYQKLQRDVTGHFRRSAAPPEDLLNEAEKARAEVERTQAASAAMIEDWRRSWYSA